MAQSAQTAPAARKSCDDLKTEIAKKLDAKNVVGYSLNVVDKGKEGDAKVVGAATAEPKVSLTPEEKQFRLQLRLSPRTQKSRNKLSSSRAAENRLDQTNGAEPQALASWHSRAGAPGTRGNAQLRSERGSQIISGMAAAKAGAT